ITAAADSVETIPPDNAISITDPPASASDAYPISTFTYVLFPTTSGKAKTLHDFITYAIGPGQKFGDKLQFAPLPAKVVSAAEQTKLWKRHLRPGLEAQGIVVAEIEDLEPKELEELERVFDSEIFPVLTPLAVGPGQPFPYISGLSLSLGLFVRDPETGEERFA